MLNFIDAKVVAADPELPALKIILDDDAALALFAKHLPGLQVTATRCTYLRYKPHTSCLATFVLDTREGKQTVHVIAHRVDANKKLIKVSRGNQTCDSLSPSPIVVNKLSMVISPFPYDSELPALEWTATRDGQLQLLSRLSPEEDNRLFAADWNPLRYKPGRRYVTRLDIDNRPQAVLKLHSEQVYDQSRRATKSLGSLSEINIARPIGHSDRHHAILLEWLPGESFASLIASDQLPPSAAREMGRILARLHDQHITKLPYRSSESEAQELHRVTNDLAAILPSMKEPLHEVSQGCTALLAEFPQVEVPIHGDCHPQQFVVNKSEVAIIDLDSAALGHPASDLGNFLAHLEREVLQRRMDRGLCDKISAELLSGYAEKTATIDPRAVQTYRAAGLLRLAHEPFRYRQPNWHHETEKMIERAADLLDAAGQLPVVSSKQPKNTVGAKGRDWEIEVVDLFSVGDDTALENADTAIDPRLACQYIVPILKQAFHDESLELRSIRVLRHKPGRRCLIEYSCMSTAGKSDVTALGKLHAKSRHERSDRLQQELWQSDFHDDSPDGISVARPLGIVPECQMWLQERVSGVRCWDALLAPGGEGIAARIADAATKLHQADIFTDRVHTIQDELQILEEKLPLVARQIPQLRSRISTVLTACRELVASVPSTEPKGIHRDFYPDQLLIDGDHLYVLDHDLYCMGDPCLDIGNFCGHLIEQSLRQQGHPNVFAAIQNTMVERFCTQQKDCKSDVIDVYTTLTLVRHIYLSTRLAGRGNNTRQVLDYCEAALARRFCWTEVAR